AMPFTASAISSSLSAWPSRLRRMISCGSTPLNLVRIEIEDVGQQVAYRLHHRVALEVGADHLGPATEFSQHLAAHAAGRDRPGKIGDDGDRLELRVAGRHRLEHRIAFGTDCGAVGDVLDIAAAEDCAVF